MTFTCGKGELFIQGFKRSSLRNGVRHIEKRRNPTVNRSPAFTLNVGFRCHAWLAEMHVVIYNAGQNKTPRGIDNGIEMPARCVIALQNIFYTIAVNGNRTFKRPTLVYDCGVFYK